MPENSTLPIEITVGLDEASLGRTLAEIKSRINSNTKQFTSSVKVSGLEQYEKQSQAIDKVTQSLFKLAKVRSPESVANELTALKQARAAWEALGPATDGYKGALDQITRRTNILTEGNARARGSFHKMIAGVASLTFELTGAVYGFLALGGAIAGGAIFGGKFLKSIEDAKHGISATISAMAYAADSQLSYAQSSAIASREIEELNRNALKYNVSLEDITKTYQAIIGPGLAAGMTLTEIGKVATIGTMAVKSMGLDSRQVVQEVRDLVQGGIQAASSTLATALGLKDSDIKAAKDSAEGLFVFLEKRLTGYQLAAAERQNTLTGAWDVLKIKIQRLFSDESGFNTFKKFLNDISDSIGVVNYQTGEIKFNPDLVKLVEQYWTTLKNVGAVLGTVIELTVKFADVITLAVTALVSFRVAALAAGPIVGIFKGLATAVTSLPTMLASTAASMGAVEVAGASLGAKMSALSLSAKGGLIGLALFAAYEAADYLGIIDWVMDSAEKRLNKFQAAITKSSTTMLAGQVDALEMQLESALKAEKTANLFTRPGAISDRQEIERKLRSAQAELNKREEQVKDKTAFEQNTGRNQAMQALIKMSANYKDLTAAQDKYKASLTEIGNLYAKATSGNATEEDKAKALEIYTRGLKEAKKELDSFGKSATTKTAKADAIDKNMLTLDKLMGDLKEKEKAASEALAQFNGTAIETELSVMTLNNTLAEFAKKGITVPKAMAAEMLKVAENTDKFKTALKEAKVFDDMRKQLAEISSATDQYVNSVNDAIAVRQEELDVIGKSGIQVELLKTELALKKEIFAIEAKYSKLLAEMPPDQRAEAADGIARVVAYEKQRAEDAKTRQQESQQRYYDEQRLFSTGWSDAFGKYKDATTDAAQQARDAFTSTTKAMEDALYSFVTTGKLNFKDLLYTILDGLLKIQIQKTIAFAMGESGGSSSSGWLGTLLSVGMSAFTGSSTGSSNAASYVPAQTSQYAIDFKAANGAVFANSPSLSAYSGSVYNSPQPFAFAAGAGIFAENGPEAIMPLKRGSNGKLGVQVSDGGSSGGTEVNVYVTVASDGSSSVQTDAATQGKGLGDLIGNAVRSELIKEQRNGGLLDRNRR